MGQYKHSHQPPRVPGFEAAGTVVESSHSEFTVGQRVLVATSGTWQRYVDVSPDNLFHLPTHLDNDYACQLYINALTAWILTTEVTKLTKEDALIINAGNSAIGKIFSQLSQSLGFQIIVVTSQPKRALTPLMRLAVHPEPSLFTRWANKGVSSTMVHFLWIFMSRVSSSMPKAKLSSSAPSS